MRQVLAHLDAGRLVDALLAMQSLWPRHRNALFAVAFDRLGAHLDRSVRALPRQRLHPAWMERCAARQPAELTSLTPRLFEGTSKRVRARLDALKERPADPRTTPALVAFVEKASPLGANGKIFTGVFRLHAHVGDPRLTEALRKRRNQLSGAEWFADSCKRFDRAVDAAPDEGPPPKGLADLMERIDTLLEGPAPGREAVTVKTRDVATSIRDSIFDDPDDDGPIAVWADALVSEGDALGELVSLQLHSHGRPRTKKQQALEKRLVKQFRNRLLGPLRPVVDLQTATFERGLLASAKVSFKSKKYRDSLRDHRWWASVHSVHTTLPHLRCGSLPRVRRFGVRYLPTPDDHPGEPLGHTWRAIDPPPWSALVSLAKAKRAMPLESVCALVPSMPDPEGLAALETRPGLPDLKELHVVYHPADFLGRDLFVEGDPMGALIDHPALRTVERLVFDGFTGARPEVPLPSIWSRCRTAGQRLVLLSSGPAVYTLWQDAGGLHADVSSAHRTRMALDGILAALGPSDAWASITIRAPSWAEALRDHAAASLDGCGTLGLPKRTRGT
jgi:hypothetical protein